ncbi:MAG: hypothetical protein EOS18_03770 [Mesorhizobium sp.]|nr:MAG: hypothetical protein EOS18_03770 [Mesorhizobium sp.]
MSVETYVRRRPNEHGSRRPETLLLTDELVRTIAAGNEVLSTDEVRKSLLAGREIYTFFSIYSLASSGSQGTVSNG